MKMFFFILPVVALLLSGETVVSGNTNDKWLSTVAQYNKDRSWNRFRDLIITQLKLPVMYRRAGVCVRRIFTHFPRVMTAVLISPNALTATVLTCSGSRRIIKD
ncbi:Testican-1 Protein SPOCK [Collichthys lucidus]|uniref:Testican-1 Protein SPOCK n=1 Tax=Collichthys lucidus TaxID=240159 RepID=A0A4U5UG82_COLLU|nr:Testican-1 Protein SPOCK [Collichthys lucidus]